MEVSADMGEMARAHIVVPKRLLEEVDRLAGSRRRSEFIATAIEKELRQRRLLAAFDDFAGSLNDVDVPGWETSDSAAEWVREQRRGWRDPWAEASDRDSQQ